MYSFKNTIDRQHGDIYVNGAGNSASISCKESGSCRRPARFVSDQVDIAATAVTFIVSTRVTHLRHALIAIAQSPGPGSGIRPGTIKFMGVMLGYSLR